MKLYRSLSTVSMAALVGAALAMAVALPANLKDDVRLFETVR